MKTNEKQSTFWVVDGLKIKKREPFVVKEVSRQLIAKDKYNKQHTPLMRPEESMVADQRNFFTEKSYEDIADKRMDYGMIRFSSLSSVRGGQVYPISFHQQTVQNVVICSPPVIVWKVDKKSPLFKNEFVKFEYNKGVHINEKGVK